MGFVVTGVAPDPFVPLYGLSDEELAARLAKRVEVNGPGFPERIEMRDAEPGETLLLVNYEHQAAETPYRSSHAIYVREGAMQAWAGDRLPDVMRRRLLSLRGFSADGMMIEADVAEGAEAEPVIQRILGNAEVAYIHAHYARPGCFAARINRG